jgi:maltose phosphorylase
VLKDQLHFDPILPKGWSAYSFKINFRGAHLKIKVSDNKVRISNLSDEKINLSVNDKSITLIGHSIEVI